MSTLITKLALGMACWTCVYSSALAIDPFIPRSKQIADSLVAITQPGYYSALYVTNVKARVNPCNSRCAIIITPFDLTPVLYARPAIVNGTTNITLVVDVVELNSVTTSGLITVRITKDALISLPDGVTTIGDWTRQPDAGGYYIFTTAHPIPAGDKITLSLTGVLTPGGSTGNLTVSATVEGGGEVKLNNNIDAEKIDYFQQ